jgi:hypothetical protein
MAESSSILDKLKSLVETLQVFWEYPVWLRIVLTIWLALSVGVLVLAIVYFAGPTLKVLTAYQLPGDRRDGVGFDFLLRNGTKSKVELIGAKLTFSHKGASLGGLQSNREVSAHYTITRAGRSDKAVARRREDGGESPATINFPFGGREEYAFVDLRMSQQIEKEDGERFQILVRAQSFPPKECDSVEAIFRYDQDKETDPFVMSLDR